MDEINSLILYGCKLARDLELNLENFSNQPNKVFASCDEIARFFNSARDQLNFFSHYEPPSLLETSGVSQAMLTLLQSQVSGDLSGGGDEGGKGSGLYGGGGGGEIIAMNMGDFGRGGSTQRPRRRKDDVEKRRMMVPAPRMGNTEIPPEDGHTWRKYGQKEILGSRFPRSYYRCTHQRLYHCPAKKQVQRLDNDPFTFEVTYRGDHTCHMSSTAPSVLTVHPLPNEMVPPQSNLQLSPATQTLTVASPPFTRWLSMNINPNIRPTYIYNDIGSGSSSSGGAGPSNIRLGPEIEYPLQVADLADAMFNIGSGKDANMDFIFSSDVEDKWEDKDDKK